MHKDGRQAHSLTGPGPQAYTGYRANDHRTHLFTLNYSYEAPKLAQTLRFNNPVGRALLDDWKVAHLLSVFSGQNFSPGFTVQQANTTTNVDLNRIFLGTPDLAPRVVVNGDPNDLSRDDAHQFDPSQLGVPGIFPAGDGTGPRNFLRGRPTFSNDIEPVSGT